MKGMNKIIRGWSFKSVLSYCEGRGSKNSPDGRLIGGNMAGQNVHELTNEFVHFRRQNAEIEKATWHNSLRLPPGDELHDHQWNEIVAEYMKRMGFKDNHPYCIWKHDDESAVHIIACRIGLDSGVYLGRNENLISTKIIQQLEVDFKLRLTKGPNYDADGKLIPKQVAGLKKKELNKAVRTGVEPTKQKLQRLIDAAIGDGVTVIQFMERLQMGGVEVRANLASTGTLAGFSFSLDQVAFKGSELGERYKWKQLQKRGVQYEQTRHGQELQRFRAPSRGDPDGDRTSAGRRAGHAETGSFDRPSDRDRVADAVYSQRTDGSVGNVEEPSCSLRSEEPADLAAERGSLGRNTGDEAGVPSDAGRGAAEHGANESDGRYGSKNHDLPEHTFEDSGPGPDRAAENRVKGWTQLPTPSAAGVNGHGGAGLVAGQARTFNAMGDEGTQSLVWSWREQHRALGAASYLVHLEPLRPDLAAVDWNEGLPMTPAEVEACLEQLRRTAARGYSVTLAPVDATTKYFVLQASQATLAGGELSPALVLSDQQQTQAVIKVFQEDADETSAEAERLLAEQLKGKPGDASEAPRMWMAGFAGGGLQSGVARIMAAAGVFCRKAAELLQSITAGLRARHKAAREKAEVEAEDDRRLAKALKSRQATPADAFIAMPAPAPESAAEPTAVDPPDAEPSVGGPYDDPAAPRSLGMRR